MTLFGSNGAPPVILESEKGWTPVGVFNWQAASAAPAGSKRRWRLESCYEHVRSSGPVALQIRLKGVSGVPVFTHPWLESADRMSAACSNWFEDNNLLQTGKGYVEARLIAPPRTPVSARLYSVQMEAWDTPEGRTDSHSPSGPDVQLAYARPLPTEKNIRPKDPNAFDPALTEKAAREFSLQFVEACLTGDLPSYYRMQSPQVRSLDSGKAMARYRLNPPLDIPGVKNLESYKNRFEFTMHPVSDLKELFPEWFDARRPWTPGPDAYLFLGHRDRFSGTFPEGVNYLVFLVEPDGSGGWKVTARPPEKPGS
ncbi:MAG: hypothetical protein CSA76_02570 [Spirochaetales bacterium]|nr:MAG: hypothetical protein CSA76_02570 [Spirochaetales bacterium]